jgi:hypothetical protein
MMFTCVISNPAFSTSTHAVRAACGSEPIGEESVEADIEEALTDSDADRGVDSDEVRRRFGLEEES